MDHLTTRMRRHAEGLIILSGAPPGRSWSAPVKLIDVMRGAVAEVEDYARVTASTQSKAALSGSAVTDVIHLLAELIENATTLSPPFTQVRVGGESVANGFAIEIEDRGLGLVAAAAGRAQRPAGEPARHQPGQHRAARPVRRRAAGQAARDQRDAAAVAVRRHHGGGAHPAGARRRGRPGRAVGRRRRGGAASAPRPRRRAASRLPAAASAYVEPAGISAGGAWAGTGSRAGAFAADDRRHRRRTRPARSACRRRPPWATTGAPATAAGPRPSGTGRPAHPGASNGAFGSPSPPTRRPRASASPGSCGSRAAPLPAMVLAPSPRARRPRRSPRGTAARPAAEGTARNRRRSGGDRGAGRQAHPAARGRVRRLHPDAPARAGRPRPGQRRLPAVVPRLRRRRSRPAATTAPTAADRDGGRRPLRRLLPGRRPRHQRREQRRGRRPLSSRGRRRGQRPHRPASPRPPGQPRPGASRVRPGRPPAAPAAVAPASAASLSDMRNTLSAMQRGWQQGRSQTQPETEDGTADGE